MSVWQLSKVHNKYNDKIRWDEMTRNERWDRNEKRIKIDTCIADVCKWE